MKTKEMTVEQLIELKAQIEEELNLRESQGTGFYKEFCLEGKAYRPASHKQYLFAESLAKKTDSVIEVSTSQICKRMEMDDMSEAIELMKEGKRIRIYQ